MDELGLNKIAAAVLATGLGFMGLKEISHAVMHVSAPETPVYKLADIAGPDAGAVEIELPFPQETWVAAMDAERGAKIFKKCTSCHNAENGGANSTGPNLWNVVGNAAGQHADFKYSGAMTNSGFTWDYETLDGFLQKPTKYLSGTAMNFVGLKKDTDRAAVIEYLRQASDAPIAQPTPAIVEASLDTDMDAATGMDAAVDEAATGASNLLGDIIDAANDGANKAIDAAEGAAETLTDAVKDVTNSEEAPKETEKEDGQH